MNEYYFSFLQATCVNEASFRTPKICIVEVYYLWAWKPFYYGTYDIIINNNDYGIL